MCNLNVVEVHHILQCEKYIDVRRNSIGYCYLHHFTKRETSLSPPLFIKFKSFIQKQYCLRKYFYDLDGHERVCSMCNLNVVEVHHILQCEKYIDVRRNSIGYC
jgi:sarcosine oxidase delta subunit